MVTQLEVMKFLRMTPFQKIRLQESDPKKYQELVQAAKKDFSPETDPAAAAELAAKKESK